MCEMPSPLRARSVPLDAAACPLKSAKRKREEKSLSPAAPPANDANDCCPVCAAPQETLYLDLETQLRTCSNVRTVAVV